MVQPELPATPASNRNSWYVAAGILAVVALIAVFLLFQRENDGVATGTSTTTTSSTTSSTSTTTTTAASTTTTRASTTTTAAPPAADTSTAVWPYAATSTRFSDPVAAARSFATDYVGFAAPVMGAFRAGDARSGEVDVRPRANGPVTTVLVRQLGNDGTWWVLGATTETIRLESVTAGSLVRSPQRLQGRAQAFEGTVDVRIRQDGSATPLATGFVTGGGIEMGPFDETMAFSAPTAGHGAVVLFTESAENGQVWQASVVRVRFS